MSMRWRNRARIRKSDKLCEGTDSPWPGLAWPDLESGYGSSGRENGVERDGELVRMKKVGLVWTAGDHQRSSWAQPGVAGRAANKGNLRNGRWTRSGQMVQGSFMLELGLKGGYENCKWRVTDVVSLQNCGLFGGNGRGEELIM